MTEYKPCPACGETELEKCGTIMMECLACGLLCNISYWNELTRLTPEQEKWLNLAPKFDTDKYEYDFLSRADKNRDGIESWWMTNKKWKWTYAMDMTYCLIRRPKLPAFSVGDGWKDLHGNLYLICKPQRDRQSTAIGIILVYRNTKTAGEIGGYSEVYPANFAEGETMSHTELIRLVAEKVEESDNETD